MGNRLSFLTDGLAEAGFGDEVWVRAGEYRPDQSLANPTGTGIRASAFALKKGVAVYGGYAGTETSRDQRDPELANLTYLSGDLAGDDADTNENGIPDGFEADPPDYSDMAENSIHILLALSKPASGQDPEVLIGPDTILDGFIIRGANANAIDEDEETYGEGVRGGGLFCGGADSGGDPNRFIDIKSSPTIARTRLEFNHAGDGYAAAIYTSYGDPVLRDLCTFADNHSDNCAGATAIEFTGVFTALGCTYQDNVASKSGGAHQSRGQSEQTIIHSCRFIGNKTTNTSIGNGGALTLVSLTSELVNCELRGNSSHQWGGAANLQNTTITNCTISDNETTGATSGRPGAGGIYASTGVTIKNSILWGNSSNYGTTLQQQISGPEGSWQCSTTYSDIQGWCSFSELDCTVPPETEPQEVDCTAGLDDETQNRDQDPEFKETDNLRLTSCSPCIDTGLNSAVPLDHYDLDDDGITDTGTVTEATPDVDITPRILNGDDTTGAVVDIGAYEYDPECPADLYPDGEVDGLDLAVLLGAWTGQEVESPCPDEDLSGDCRVNGFDLAILLGAWGECEGVCNQEFSGGGGEEEEEDGTIAQLVAWYLAGDMAAIIQWLIEQGY